MDGLSDGQLFDFCAYNVKIDYAYSSKDATLTWR